MCEGLQVKKLEDKCGQLSRDKEELCQALTAVKKGQSVAAGPGQTRTLNLMRRVHSLVRDQTLSSCPLLRDECPVMMTSCQRLAGSKMSALGFQVVHLVPNLSEARKAAIVSLYTSIHLMVAQERNKGL